MLFATYTFQGQSRYIVPGESAAAHGLVAVRHSALVAPWADPGVHVHEQSEEYYLLLQGQLRFWVAESVLTLQPNEMLMVRPGLPHAIVGGQGLIEHFGFRAPAPKDKHIEGSIPPQLPQPTQENERELRQDWGYRIPLYDRRNRNCWLIGLGGARFHSPAFPAGVPRLSDIRSGQRRHRHTSSPARAPTILGILWRPRRDENPADRR